MSGFREPEDWGTDFLGNSYGESLTFIGDVKKPLWLGKRKDQAALLDQEMYQLIEYWQKFNIGMGLPILGSWVVNDPHIVNAITDMENYYRLTRSAGAAQIKWLEVIAKNIRR